MQICPNIGWWCWLKSNAIIRIRRIELDLVSCPRHRWLTATHTQCYGSSGEMCRDSVVLEDRRAAIPVHRVPAVVRHASKMHVTRPTMSATSSKIPRHDDFDDDAAQENGRVSAPSARYICTELMSAVESVHVLIIPCTLLRRVCQRRWFVGPAHRAGSVKSTSSSKSERWAQGHRWWWRRRRRWL